MVHHNRGDALLYFTICFHDIDCSLARIPTKFSSVFWVSNNMLEGHLIGIKLRAFHRSPHYVCTIQVSIKLNFPSMSSLADPFCCDLIGRSIRIGFLIETSVFIFHLSPEGTLTC